jgi:type II secretory pathway component PulJ
MVSKGKLLTVKGRRGYLLFEVLLSLVILSAGLIMISKSFLSSISASGLVKSHSQAVLLLERKLAEVESGEIAIAPYTEDTVEGEEGEFKWEIQSKKPGEDIDFSVPFTEVQVKISWEEKGREREVLASLGIAH